MVVGCQLRHLSTRKLGGHCLLHQTNLFHHPGIQALFRQGLFELLNAFQNCAVGESLDGEAAVFHAPAMGAVQHLDDVVGGNRSQNSHGEAIHLGVRLFDFIGIGRLDEVDLDPGTLRESDFENHRLTDEGVDAIRVHIAHGGGTRVCVSFSRIGTEEAIVVASGLYEAGSGNFEAAVAVGAVVKIELFLLSIIIQTGKLSRELRQSRRDMVIVITFQDFVLTMKEKREAHLLIPYALLCEPAKPLPRLTRGGTKTANRADFPVSQYPFDSIDTGSGAI